MRNLNSGRISWPPYSHVEQSVNSRASSRAMYDLSHHVIATGSLFEANLHAG